MGMGEIEIHSYLNQPFNAEIPITDIDGVSLDNIRVTLASVEEYARIGLTANEILSFLRFSIKKDPNGQPIIVITSTERIPEPYLQIVVDLAWPAGQIYRAYTILLDPPGYKVKKSSFVTGSKKVNINKIDIGEPGVVDKPVYQDMNGKIGNEGLEVTYGPTLANESIWQIAQRYKTAEATLPQVILAIVGANLDAFTKGNLNGLQVGERLKIPSSEQIVQIPMRLAIEEIAAHDVAWRNKQEIKHVIFPPYINNSTKNSKIKESDTTYFESKIVPLPKFNLETPSLPNDAASLPAPEVFFTTSNTTIPSITPKSSKNLAAQKSNNIAISAGLGVTLAALDTVRTENSLIKDQLDKLKAANNQLQQQVKKQQKAMAILQEQLKVIMQERQGLHAQTSSLNSSDSFPWLYWLLMGGSSIVILYGLLYWLWLRHREAEEEELNEDAETTVIVPPTVNNSYKKTSPESDYSQANASITELDKSTSPTKNSPVEPLTVQKMQAHSAPITEVEPTAIIKTDNDKEQLKNPHSEAIDLSQQEKAVEIKHSNPALSSLDNTDKVSDDEASIANNQVIEKQQSSISQAPRAPAESAKEVSIEEVNNSIKKANSSSEMNLTKNATSGIKNKPHQDANYVANELESDIGQDPLMPNDESFNEIQQPTDSHMPYKLNNEEDYAVDFEPGLDKLIKPKPKQMIRDEQSLDFVIDDQIEDLLKNIKPKTDANSAKTETSVPLATDPSLDTTKDTVNENLSDSHETLNTEETGSINQMKSENSTAENANTENLSSDSQLVKSQTALNTLLSLAETYIAMEDFESAEQSLEEVIKFGNAEQKVQAEKLLQQLNK